MDQRPNTLKKNSKEFRLMQDQLHEVGQILDIIQKKKKDSHNQKEGHEEASLIEIRNI